MEKSRSLAGAPLNVRGEDGVYREQFGSVPEHSRELRLPEWRRAVYWAAFQKYDMAPQQPLRWPDGANRVQPLLVKTFADLTPGGLQVVLELGKRIIYVSWRYARGSVWRGSLARRTD